MAGKRADLTDPEQQKRSARRYGMGRGMFGNDQGEKDIEQSLGSPTKDTQGLMTQRPDNDGSVLPDLERKMKERPRASDAPGAIIPWVARDEALLDIISNYDERLYEAPVEVLDLCMELLREVRDPQRFHAIRQHFESLGLKNLPVWEKQDLHELQGGLPGLPGPQLGGNTGAGLTPTSQSRTDKGFTFYVPKPPSAARKQAGRRNARKVGPGGGMHSRMARARDVLDTVKKRSREKAGKANGDRMRGSKGPNFRRAGASDDPLMHLAAGKYDDLSHGKVRLQEGYPQMEDGMPWFHGTARREIVGGVSCIQVDEGHIICSGALPRPKHTEGFKVWDCRMPLAMFEMELAFSRLTEGMESERPWLKSKDNVRVLGIPTEGLIVRETRGKNQETKLEFLSFDSESGRAALQEYMVAVYAEKGSQAALDEAVTYGYVRAGAADLILDRVMRNLNRLNRLDVFEDALFDHGSEALYVLLNPELGEAEVQEVAHSLQSEYPEVQILGGPLDEDMDWWVLYLPREGMDFGPQLDRIFEPRIGCPLDNTEPDLVGQAIHNVVAQV